MAILIAGGLNHDWEGLIAPTDCIRDALKSGTSAGA